jgi:hypothetical protein
MVVAMVGRNRPRNPTRDELMRQIVCAFGDGRIQTISYYEGIVGRLSSRTAVRREIHSLEARGLLLLQPSRRDGRALCVVPSDRMITTFTRALADIRARIEAQFLKENADS